jgi:hypothetical protein
MAGRRDKSPACAANSPPTSRTAVRALYGFHIENVALSRRGPPYYRGLGKKVLYAVSDLDGFIRSSRVDPEKGL